MTKINYIMRPSGCQEWTDENGNLHREDGGPSFINSDKGYWQWNKHGNYHRVDGPARIWTKYGGSESWYIDGKVIPPEVLKAWMEECNINPNWSEWTDVDKVVFKLRFCRHEVL